jgi:hypothetical protein
VLLPDVFSVSSAEQLILALAHFHAKTKMQNRSPITESSIRLELLAKLFPISQDKHGLKDKRPAKLII